MVNTVHNRKAFTKFDSFHIVQSICDFDAMPVYKCVRLFSLSFECFHLKHCHIEIHIQVQTQIHVICWCSLMFAYFWFQYAFSFDSHSPFLLLLCLFYFGMLSTAEGLISTETFCRIFPFHVMFDRHMQIVQVGKSVSRIIPR